MSEGFYVTFMSNVSDPFYDNLNKTSNFWTKLSPAIKFEGRCELALVDCILKNRYDIQRKDRTYNIRIRPHDWPIVDDQYVIENMNSYEYPFATLSYKEFRSMSELCRAINKKFPHVKMVPFYSNIQWKRGKSTLVRPLTMKRFFSMII